MTISTMKMTAEQYLQLGEDPPGVRLELVNGEVAVSPSPTPGHARTVFQLSLLLGNHVESGQLGELLLDCDTIFGKHDVRRPDLLFFTEARRDQMGEKKLIGRPDLAVEVISESSDRIDRADKFKQYAKGGVKYYWIVDPLDKSFEGFVLKAGKYSLATRGSGEDVVRAVPFKGLEIPLKNLWWRPAEGGARRGPKPRSK